MQADKTANEILIHAANFGFCSFSANAVQIEELIQSLRRRNYSVTNTALHIKRETDARSNTLSAKYGSAAFPFHTDFAFRPLPPRYILLANVTDFHFQRPTLVARIELLAPSLRNLIRNSVWKLILAPKHYFVSGQFIRSGHSVWRWDCDFLAPSNTEAREACQLIPAAMSDLAEPITWGRLSAVLIDNWHCAHARGDEPLGGHNESGRALLRYEFWGDARMVV